MMLRNDNPRLFLMEKNGDTWVNYWFHGNPRVDLNIGVD